MYIAINDLPRDQRFLQVNVIIPVITPGPSEPNTPQLNNCMEPMVREICELKNGA